MIGYRKLIATLMGCGCVTVLAWINPTLGADAIKAVVAMVGAFLAVNYARKPQT